MQDILQYVTKSVDFVERRRTARLNASVKTRWFTVGAEGIQQEQDYSVNEAVVRDISLGGCLLLATQELGLNSEIGLEIFLRQTDSVKVFGRVLRLSRAEGGLFEYGITFSNVDKETRRIFADYFFTKMYELTGLSSWPTDKPK